MIKRIASLIACVGFLPLGGCNVLTALKVDPATISAAQQIAVQVCGFLPTVETIEKIVTGGILVLPEAVANAICAAVNAGKAPAGMAVGRFGAPVGHTVGSSAAPTARVGNIQVEGIYVR